MTPKQVVEFAKKNKVKFIDYKFIDFPGIWQHFSTPVSEFDAKTFEEGLGFDGSSIRGWQAINNSDMILIPDPSTAMMDPFRKYPTMSLICNVVDPITKEQYNKVRIGMTLAGVEQVLGKKGTDEGTTFYLWKMANLRVAFTPSGQMAGYTNAEISKGNALFDDFKEALQKKIKKDGKPFNREEVETVLGNPGEKMDLSEFVWVNSNRARIKILFKDGKAKEIGYNGRLK